MALKDCTAHKIKYVFHCRRYYDIMQIESELYNENDVNP